MADPRDISAHGALTRRSVLQWGTVAAISACAWPLPFVARANALGQLSVAGRTLSVLSDGAMSLPLSFLLPDQPRGEAEALFAKHDMVADPLTPDCNVTLLRDGGRAALFDAGAGPGFMSTTGRLQESLKAADIDPASITDVIFTHAHPDHLWGVVDDFDELVFPNAVYRIAQAEWDFWRADDTLEKMPDARKNFVIGAQNRFAAIEEKIVLFRPGDEVFPQVEAVDTAGHTPGHVSFAVHGGDDSMMVLGDAIANVVVSFERPDWRFGSDHDPDRGVVTRRALLDRLAGEGARIVGFHLPHPGIGRVERAGTAYRFVAA